MKTTRIIAALGVVALGANAGVAHAQSQRIPIHKDVPATTSTTTTTTTTTTSGEDVTWNGPLGYTLRPGGMPVYCRPEDQAEVAKIAIKTDRYDATTMISPDQAKAIALCAVPGQLASGAIDDRNGRPVYQINVLPTNKKTETKVDVDAMTGEVTNAKQLGGLRGLAGYLRESANRKKNKTNAPQ